MTSAATSFSSTTRGTGTSRLTIGSSGDGCHQLIWPAAVCRFSGDTTLGPSPFLSSMHAGLLRVASGVVDLSWWGVGSYTDPAVSTVMDVMHAHDLKVTFHLEPFRPRAGRATTRRRTVFAARIWGRSEGGTAFTSTDVTMGGERAPRSSCSLRPYRHTRSTAVVCDSRWRSSLKTAGGGGRLTGFMRSSDRPILTCSFCLVTAGIRSVLLRPASTGLPITTPPRQRMRGSRLRLVLHVAGGFFFVQRQSWF
ncbi:MAG: hypothetical protein Ct9H300mP25_11850 [Acidobacteriota bacterium]|nr:MAG: hypothetical protein Ct9H300mP25_11850 [Acidobacteriota bacterium]